MRGFLQRINDMHKLTPMLAAGAVGALIVSAATRTEAAGAATASAGLRVAGDDMSAIQNVQYRRGYGYAPGYRAYGYPPGHPGYGYPADLNSTLGDGPDIGIQRANGGFSDAAFGFSPTGSISDGR
jgi:hypothetical protein